MAGLKKIGAFSFLFIFLLPACSPKQPEKKTQKDRYQSGSDPFFSSTSERAIRDDVREHHVFLEGKKVENSSIESTFGKTSKKSKKIPRKKRAAIAQENARRKEARLIDIPVLLSSKPIYDFFSQDFFDDSGGLQLGYKTNLLPSEVVSFYQQEMERNGWRTLSFFQGNEISQIFVKPGRVCAISIRPHESMYCRCKTEGATVIISTGSAQTNI